MHMLLPTLAAALLPFQDDYPEFPGLTDNLREVVNFNVEPVRPMVQASDGTLFALNVHASQIVFHADLGATPEAIFPTLLNPVSIALWGNSHIVVASAGTHALALHDRTTGAVLDVLPLPSEPADLVIDPDLDVALVACQGENVVVKVDLTTFQEIVRYEIPSERPRFLYFDRGGDGTLDNRVFVAPFISGNNSSVTKMVPPGELAIVADLDGLPLSAQLPDEDLFEIDVNSNAPGAAVAVKRRVGTLLTAHGRHPDGDYWMLNVESINKDPARQSEPLLKGDFAKNRVWIGTPSASNLTTTPAEFVDLDLAAGSSTYSPNDAVAFPFGLAFEPIPGGRAFVTSPLDDVVSIRDASGQPVGRIVLPDGSIPMDVEVDQITHQLIFAYCWGTNEVRVIAVSNPAVVFPLTLGLDPTPDPVRRGRELWYDGHRSLNARSSCNTCHPGGKSDFLGWQISDDPTDTKDVMVTQSLLGIEDTFPYHWRGERALIDFNGAFVELLGGPAPLSTVPIAGQEGIEFDDFQAFVFSLQPHANPREDLSRRVAPTADPFPTGFDGDAAAGVDHFTMVSGFTGRTCEECHIGQTGGNGDFVDDTAFLLPSAKNIETAHLRELTHKDQVLVPLTLGTITTFRPRTGFGTNHEGLGGNIFTFVQGGTSFNLDGQQTADVAALVRRFDQGIAPTAHEARMLDSAHAGNVAEIQNLLLPQAATPNEWIDLVAFGTFVNPATSLPTTSRWWFDPALGEFTSDDPTLGNQPLSTFTAPATLAQTSMVFVGVPPGNGHRFGVDTDNDGIRNLKEAGFGTHPMIPDSDGDGQPDGYEVSLGSNPASNTSLGTDNQFPSGTLSFDFANASLAKLFLEADEEVTVSGTFGTLGGVTRTYSSPLLARKHTVVLQGLEPSTPSGFTGIPGTTNMVLCSLTITDRGNNSTPINAVSFPSGEMILIPGTTVGTAPMKVEVITGAISPAGGAAQSRTLTAKIEIGQRHLRPGAVDPAAANNRMVLLEPLVEDLSNPGTFLRATGTTTLGTALATVTTQNGPVSTQILPGNYIVTPLTATVGGTPGSATVDVTLPNLAVGQGVRLRVIAILEPQLPLASPPVFLQESFNRYFLPATSPENRGVNLVVP